MEYNFVVFSMGAHFFRFMYQEMLDMDNVQIYWQPEDLLQLLSPVEKKLANIHLNAKIRIPFKNIWYKKAVKKLHFSNNHPICFIWHFRFITLIDYKIPYYIKNKFLNSRQMYFLTDASRMNTDAVKELKQQMDMVAIYDPEIARKNNIGFFPNVYPLVQPCRRKEYQYDICFIGEDKGRENLLLEIAKLCEKHSIKAAFYIRKLDAKTWMGMPGPEDAPENVHYLLGSKKISHTETIEIVQNSRCLLELGVSPTYACSLRVQEAVVLNKKLLTDNPNVYHMPCCQDSKWISCFERAEDIDWDFVKTDAEVDYHYKGEFSARTWLNSIEQSMQKLN